MTNIQDNKLLRIYLADWQTQPPVIKVIDLPMTPSKTRYTPAEACAVTPRNVRTLPTGVDKIGDSTSPLTVLKGEPPAKALDNMDNRMAAMENIIEGFLLERFPVYAKILVEFYLGLFGFQGRGRSAFAANTSKKVEKGQWLTRAQVIHLEEAFCRENELNTSHSAEAKSILASINAAVEAQRCVSADASALQGILFQFQMIKEEVPKEDHDKLIQEIQQDSALHDLWEKKVLKSKYRIVTPRPGFNTAIRL